MKKRLNTIFEILLSICAIIVIIYILAFFFIISFSFLTWDFQPVHWLIESLGFLRLALFLGILFGIISYLEKLK